MPRSIVSALAPLCLLVLGLLTGVAAPASAAPADPPARLLVEIPKGSESVKDGEQVAVQVVGESASGDRVGFPGRRVEITASAGKIEVIKRPYSYRYTPPVGLKRPVRVTLSAHLEGSPEIRGEVVLRAYPNTTGRPAPRFERLVVRSNSASVALGSRIKIEVLGDPGTTKEAIRPVKEPVTLKIVGSAKAAGTLTPGRGHTYFYTAPPVGGAYAAGDRLRIEAVLESDGRIRGQFHFKLVNPSTGTTPPERPGPGGHAGDAGVEKPPVKPERPNAVPPTKEKPDAKGIALSSMHVRLMVWRTKDTAAETFTNDRAFPKDATHFIAPAAFHKMRFVVERKDVVEVQMTWFIGKKKGAKIHTVKPANAGALRVTRNKQGKLAIHMELDTPDNKKPLEVELLLKLESGRTLRQPFTLRRGHDKNRDGVPDGKQKK